MNRSVVSLAFATLLPLTCAGIGWGAEYRAPLPYPTMYDLLKVGIGWRQAHDITRAQELEREPADLDASDLLRLELVNRHCQAQLLRLHWFKGELHWVEYFQLDPAGVTYAQRGDPDPIAERLIRRLTEISTLYAAAWESLTASITAEGSPALQAKANQAKDQLKQRIEQLRGNSQR